MHLKRELEPSKVITTMSCSDGIKTLYYKKITGVYNLLIANKIVLFSIRDASEEVNMKIQNSKFTEIVA